MPRLTTKDYLNARYHLSQLWNSDQSRYALLSSIEQWYLHDYFRPSIELTDKAALTHRRQVTIDRPSLPQCAGRTYRLLLQLDQRIATSRPATSHTRGERRVTVRAVVRPEIDVKALARIFVELALAEQRRNAKGKTAI